MTETDQTTNASLDAWEAPVRDGGAREGEELVVDVSGFEGPLDLLLALARTQKVDLANISVLALAEQYIAFIDEAREMRLELAADYLVMAAWLTFLKSRLLLPREEVADDEPTGEELAQRLAFRLMRLEAMRDAAARLMTRNRLGRDVFVRGMPEAVKTKRETKFKASLFDLLQAYADQRKRTLPRVHVISRRPVWSIKNARSRLTRLIAEVGGDWLQLDRCVVSYSAEPAEARTAMASTLGATLEMAREGVVEVRQEEAFAPVHVRRRAIRDAADIVSWRREQGQREQE
ncbi:MAG: segregation and condensation protein A [Hyphomicrobiaceae bacterium]